jgi:hypothetical protein
MFVLRVSDYASKGDASPIIQVKETHVCWGVSPFITKAGASPFIMKADTSPIPYIERRELEWCVSVSYLP